MRVVVLQHEEGNTIAIVPDDALLFGQKVVEIDQEDSTGILKDNPEMQLQLQRVFNDVMEMFGFKLAPPKRDENDA
jgi:hypothetical protein